MEFSSDALLVPLFFLTAYFYSMAGFGGASTYSALLILMSGLAYQQIPIVALSCNILVVTGNLYHFEKWNHLHPKRLFPFLAGSMPFAFLGGLIPVSKLVYQTLLGAMLFLAALKLLLKVKSETTLRTSSQAFSKTENKIKTFFLKGALPGAVIGFCSGLTGIGGGILLAPLLYFLKWRSPKEIAAASSLFILINSSTGLAGQIYKGAGEDLRPETLLLGIAVFFGGQAGVRKTCGVSTQEKVRTVTALLLLFAAVRLQLPGLKFLFD